MKSTKSLYDKGPNDLEFKINSLKIENENLKSLIPNPITEILTQDEIMFLIQYIGEANFKGKDVEKIYSIVLKLQNLYVYYQKKK